MGRARAVVSCQFGAVSPCKKCLTRPQQPTDGDRATAQPIEQPTCGQKHTYRASAWSTVRPENHDNALRARAGSRAWLALSQYCAQRATHTAGHSCGRPDNYPMGSCAEFFPWQGVFPRAGPAARSALGGLAANASPAITAACHSTGRAYIGRTGGLYGAHGVLGEEGL